MGRNLRLAHQGGMGSRYVCVRRDGGREMAFDQVRSAARAEMGWAH